MINKLKFYLIKSYNKMKKFCDICKQIIKCEYCTKYGKNGKYIYLEKKFYDHRQQAKQKKIDIDLINQQQLFLFSNTKKH